MAEENPPPYVAMLSEEERGYRQAMIEVRSFIAHHGKKDVDAFCMQALHDICVDAEHRDRTRRADDAKRRTKSHG